MKTIIKIILLSSCVALLLASCKTVSYQTYEKKDFIRPQKLVERMLDSFPRKPYISYKISAEYALGNAQPETFSGIVRIKRDSVIWISLRSFNIEGFRVCVTQDSIKLMNRLKNQYMSEHISKIEDVINVDFTYDELQSILLNEFFFYPSPEDTIKAINGFRNCNDSVYYCISSISQKRFNRNIDKQNKPNAIQHGDWMLQTIKIIPGTFNIKSIFIEDFETRSTYITYDNFAQSGNISYPQKMHLEADAENIQGRMDFDVYDYETDEVLTFPFKISSKYTKIEVNEKK